MRFRDARRAWGWALVGAAALVGCSPSSPRAASPERPAAAAPSAAPAASAEPPPAPGVGPFLPALPEDQAPGQEVQFHEEWVPFGKGTFVHTRLTRFWQRSDELCDWGGSVCGQFAFVPSAGEFRWTNEPAMLESPSRWTRAAHQWTRFAAGSGGVYGLRRGENVVVDRLDAGGQVTPFVEAKNLPFGECMRFWVIEAGATSVLVMAGLTNYPSLELTELFAAEIAAGEPGAPGKLGEIRKLDVALRPVNYDNRPPGSGPGDDLYLTEFLHVVPLLDEPEPGAWALVWVLGRDLHVSRYSGARLVRDDKVNAHVFSPRVSISNVLGGYVASEPFVVTSSPQGVEVNGVTYGRTGKQVASRPAAKAGAAAPPQAAAAGRGASSPGPTALAGNRYLKVALVPEQDVLGAGFDPVLKEGALLIKSAQGVFLRRFDSSGNYTSSPEPVALGKDVVIDGAGAMTVKNKLLPRPPSGLASKDLLPPGLLRSCPHAIPTGPKSRLLVCSDLGDAQRPGVRAGLRVFRGPEEGGGSKAASSPSAAPAVGGRQPARN